MKYSTDDTDKRITENNKELFFIVKSLLAKLVSLRAKRSNLIDGRLLRHFVPRNDTLSVFKNHSSVGSNCFNLDTIAVKSVLISIRALRGQSLTEFALCMVVVVTAFVSMQMYVQRGWQARQRDAVEYLHSEIEKEAGNKGNSKLAAGLKNLNRQYEVSYKESTMTENTKSKIKTGFPDSETYEEITRSGKEKTKF